MEKTSEVVKPKCKPKPEQPSRKSLCQARLDRIAHPTSHWYRAYLHWFARMSGDRARYPSVKIKTYYQETLGPLIAEIELVVMSPPNDLDGETWELYEDEYQRLLGRAKAIVAVLDLRAKQPNVGCGSETVSEKPPEKMPNDPFEE